MAHIEMDFASGGGGGEIINSYISTDTTYTIEKNCKKIILVHPVDSSITDNSTFFSISIDGVTQTQTNTTVLHNESTHFGCEVREIIGNFKKNQVATIHTLYGVSLIY